MDIAETTRLCRAIASIKPAQAFDEETPAFWAVLLADVSYADARTAMLSLATKIPFIGPDNILAEVKSIRRQRLEHSDQICPDVDPDDWRAWLAARRAGLKAMADGDLAALPTPSGEIEPRLLAALPSVFKRPPKPLAITAEGGDRPKAKAAKPRREVTEVESARMEAERARQLEALRIALETRKPRPIDKDAS